MDVLFVKVLWMGVWTLGVKSHVINFVPEQIYHQHLDEDCATIYTKVNEPEEISCKFDNSFCCWKSMESYWKLSNSSQYPEITGNGNFLIFTHNRELNAVDRLHSPKFKIPRYDTLISFEFFCTGEADIDMNYKTDKFDTVIGEEFDCGPGHTWNSVQYSATDDFQNLPLKYENLQITLSGTARSSELLAIRNFRLHVQRPSASPNVDDLTASTKPMNYTVSANSNYTESFPSSNSNSETSSLDNTTLYVTTESKWTETEEIYDPQDIKCKFDESDCGWTYNETDWKLSNSSTVSEIPEKENFMLKEPHVKVSWLHSPKFYLPTFDVFLTFKMFCTGNSRLEIYYKIQRQYLFGEIFPCFPLSNDWEMFNYSLADDLEDISTKSLQIVFKGESESNEILAVKNVELESSSFTTAVQYTTASTHYTNEENISWTNSETTFTNHSDDDKTRSESTIAYNGTSASESTNSANDTTTDKSTNDGLTTVSSSETFMNESTASFRENTTNEMTTLPHETTTNELTISLNETTTNELTTLLNDTTEFSTITDITTSVESTVSYNDSTINVSTVSVPENTTNEITTLPEETTINELTTLLNDTTEISTITDITTSVESTVSYNGSTISESTVSVPENTTNEITTLPEETTTNELTTLPMNDTTEFSTITDITTSVESTISYNGSTINESTASVPENTTNELTTLPEETTTNELSTLLNETTQFTTLLNETTQFTTLLNETTQFSTITDVTNTVKSTPTAFQNNTSELTTAFNESVTTNQFTPSHDNCTASTLTDSFSDTTSNKSTTSFIGNTTLNSTPFTFTDESTSGKITSSVKSGTSETTLDGTIAKTVSSSPTDILTESSSTSSSTDPGQLTSNHPVTCVNPEPVNIESYLPAGWNAWHIILGTVVFTFLGCLTTSVLLLFIPKYIRKRNSYIVGRDNLGHSGPADEKNDVITLKVLNVDVT